MEIYRIIIIAILSVWTFLMMISVDKKSAKVMIPWIIINIATVIYLILN